jgi:hypothetical protein
VINRRYLDVKGSAGSQCQPVRVLVFKLREIVNIELEQGGKEAGIAALKGADLGCQYLCHGL